MIGKVIKLPPLVPPWKWGKPENPVTLKLPPLVPPWKSGGFHFLNSSRRKSETFTIIRSFFR
jgi:hypothetical protein